MEQEVASPSSKLPLSHSPFFLKDNSCVQLNSTISSVLACRIREVQQPSFISSQLCPFQSKLAAFLLRQLIGPTSHRPNLFSKGCPATPLVLLPEHCLVVPLQFVSVHSHFTTGSKKQPDHTFDTSPGNLLG